MPTTYTPDRPASEERTRPDAQHVADQAKETLAKEARDARDRLSSAGKGIRDKAGSLGSTFTSVLSEQAEHRKSEVAEGLRSLADTMRHAADEREGQALPGQFVHEAAAQLDRLSGLLEDNSIRQMSDQVRSFSRENPATFMAGCLFAGLAVGRLLTASSARAQNHASRDRDWLRDLGQNGGIKQEAGAANHSSEDISTSPLSDRLEGTNAPFTASPAGETGGVVEPHGSLGAGGSDAIRSSTMPTDPPPPNDPRGDAPPPKPDNLLAEKSADRSASIKGGNDGQR